MQKYCSNTAHLWGCFTPVGNKRNWNSLPEDMRQLVTRVFDAPARRSAGARGARHPLDTRPKGFGMQFNGVGGKPFRAALQKAGYYAEWQKKFGTEAWALLEKYAGKLA